MIALWPHRPFSKKYYVLITDSQLFFGFISVGFKYINFFNRKQDFFIIIIISNFDNKLLAILKKTHSNPGYGNFTEAGYYFVNVGGNSPSVILT